MSTMYPNRKLQASGFVSDLRSSFLGQSGNNAHMQNRIKELRKKLGLSQEALGKYANTTKATIMKLETGKMNLTTRWMNQLAPHLHCRPEDLLPDSKPVDDNLRDSELAIIYTLKAILKILLQKNATSPKALDVIFSQALESYQTHQRENAALVIDDLRKFAVGTVPSSEKEVIRKLLELSPLGSA